MAHRMRLMSSLLSIAAIAGYGVAISPLPSQAQGTPGLTIFSGVERENQLGYRMDFFGRPGARDRYRLRIPRDKMTVAVSEFFVDYPETYRGRFDPNAVRLQVNGDPVDLDEVIWDAENRVISIYPTEPVPANTRIEIVLSNVRNPNRVGTHYFNALVVAAGDIPVRQYLGTWILSIGPND
ncbi:DUF2808 domain-containing protein [Thermocoleostomius sinensis]|uniref:DUF2808 domain-containing protein n=1 Tax=Thermocoleostomius sinensis A174 TaxID=2016057 RepID=A0A9E8ZFN7_9CYAN|nr:DUF2808 domain-containing protein [Thermocoleostomius sinensis]WAL62529.1 DUF2808 domain-containing protein [Thermocoleostomius sinensis A174]